MSEETVTTPPEENTPAEPETVVTDTSQTTADEKPAEESAAPVAAEEAVKEEEAVEEAGPEQAEPTADTTQDSAEVSGTAEADVAEEETAQEPATAEETTAPAAEEATPVAEEPAAPATPAPVKPTPKPAAPHPSPAAFAGKGHRQQAVTPPAYSEADVKAAEAFGRVGDNGIIYVKDGDGERAVGQYPDVDTEKALEPYAKRYLELKARLDQFRVRLASPQIRPGEITKSLSQLQSEVAEPQVVGDLDALRAEFGDLKVAGDAKKEQIEKDRKDAYDKALAERTAIVEKAEALAAGLGDNTNWHNTGDEFKKLFDEWQAHQKNSSVRLSKTDADALWKRFSTSRSTFSTQRRKWSQARDAQRAEVRATKEQIIKEAEAIKNSTDWRATSDKFNDLMNRWKKAGRINREEDDKLWAQFRAAADTFFTARNADRDKTSEDEKANLAKKEALLAQAQKLVPVKDAKEAKKARHELSKIQDEWDKIGYVPRSDIHRIESALDNVEKQIKAVEDAEWKKSDPQTEARKSDFQRQLEAKIADLDAQIAAEKDPKKKAALEADKAAWEKLIPSK